MVTSTLNAADLLPYTLQSVNAQDHAVFEWIIVDGCSTDGTVSLLQQHSHCIDHWISEPDSRIYDAWNKATELATGEWLLFIGAGDEFSTPHTLASASQCLRAAYPAHQVVYGKLTYLSSGTRQPIEEVGKPWAELENQWEIGRPALPPHPATFHHRTLFQERPPFDTGFLIASDAHFLLRRLREIRPLFIPIKIVATPLGGVSFRLASAVQIAREIQTMNRELGLHPPLTHRIAEAVKLGLKFTFDQYLPSHAAHWLADFLRILTGKNRRWSIR